MTPLLAVTRCLAGSTLVGATPPPGGGPGGRPGCSAPTVAIYARIPAAADKHDMPHPNAVRLALERQTDRIGVRHIMFVGGGGNSRIDGDGWGRAAGAPARAAAWRRRSPDQS